MLRMKVCCFMHAADLSSGDDEMAAAGMLVKAEPFFHQSRARVLSVWLNILSLSTFARLAKTSLCAVCNQLALNLSWKKYCMGFGK
jgi:hypothetical protein